MVHEKEKKAQQFNFISTKPPHKASYRSLVTDKHGLSINMNNSPLPRATAKHTQEGVSAPAPGFPQFLQLFGKEKRK